MKYTLALSFVVIQVAGEALRIPLMPLALSQMVFFCAIVIITLTFLSISTKATCYFGSIDKSILLFALYLMLAVMIGLYGGAGLGRINEDLVPLLILLSSYLATRIIVRNTSSMRTIIDGILLGSFLAALKLIIIVISPVQVDWTGPWQALRSEGYGLVRVILNGADLFFVVSTIMTSVLWLTASTRGNWRNVAGMLSVVAVFFAGTRSNWAGLGLALLVVIIIAGSFSLIRWRRVFLIGTIGTVLLISMFVVSGSIQSAASDGGPATTHDREIPIVLRLLESEGILKQINNAVILGNGMGSTYEYFNLFNVVSTQWSHNAYLMLILKGGILGFILFFMVVFRVMRQALRLVRTEHPWRVELIGLMGAIIAVLVLSIGANKIFSFSGCIFLGVAFAIVQIAKIYSRSLNNPSPAITGQQHKILQPVHQSSLENEV